MYKQTDDAQWKAILVPCAIQENITKQIQTNKQTTTVQDTPKRNDMNFVPQ